MQIEMEPIRVGRPRMVEPVPIEYLTPEQAEQLTPRQQVAMKILAMYLSCHVDTIQCTVLRKGEPQPSVRTLVRFTPRTAKKEGT